MVIMHIRFLFSMFTLQKDCLQRPSNQPLQTNLNCYNQNHDSIFILRDGSPAKASSMKFWIQKWDEYCTEKFGKPVYFHMFRHRWTSYLLGIGVEKELVQEMQNWCSDQLCDLYNDNTAKDRKWKGLDKLKTALEQDEMVQKTQQVEGKIEEEKEATKNST